MAAGYGIDSYKLQVRVRVTTSSACLTVDHVVEKIEKNEKQIFVINAS
jgi:hypothetical protein